MCRARCITHQGKIISATGVHNHAPHMRGNNSMMGPNADVIASGGGSGNANNTQCPPPPQTAQQTSGATGGMRFPQNVSSPGVNMFQNSFHGPHHGHPMSPMTPPSMQHAHPISADPATSINSTTSHHFVTSMSNLVQHPSSHQLMPPTTVSTLPQLHTTTNNVIQTIMHGSAIHSPQQSQAPGGYDMPTPTTGLEHSRITQQQSISYDAHDKTDDHIPVHNTAELSPSHPGGHCSGEEGHHQSLNKSTPVQHQSPHHQHQPVQVIDSITISPGGNGHNFKMEPL